MDSQVTHNNMSDASMPNPSTSGSLQAIAERFIDRLFTVVDRI